MGKRGQKKRSNIRVSWIELKISEKVLKYKRKKNPKKKEIRISLHHREGRWGNELKKKGQILEFLGLN